MTKLDMLENRVKVAYLALGSNLGNRYINIELAKVFLLNNNIKIYSIGTKFCRLC